MEGTDVDTAGLVALSPFITSWVCLLSSRLVSCWISRFGVRWMDLEIRVGSVASLFLLCFSYRVFLFFPFLRYFLCQVPPFFPSAPPLSHSPSFSPSLGRVSGLVPTSSCSLLRCFPLLGYVRLLFFEHVPPYTLSVLSCTVHEVVITLLLAFKRDITSSTNPNIHLNFLHLTKTTQLPSKPLSDRSPSKSNHHTPSFQQNV